MAINLRQIAFGKVAQGACIAAAAIGVSLTAGQQQAQAFQFGNIDYAIGSQTNGSGGAVYQYQGIAIKESGNKITVAMNTGMSLAGSSSGINYGAMFFNFSPTKTFNAANGTNKMFGVHFATTNSESGVTATGLYSNVTAKSVTGQNQGWSSLTKYNSWAAGASKDGASYGDLNSNSSYFDQQGPILNSIATGTKVADITMLNAAQLLSEGFNFKGAAGSVNSAFTDGGNLVGFSFDKTADFNGSFMANIFAECGNDGLVISSEATPEPTTMAGMALAGAGMSYFKRRQKKQAA